VGLEPETRAACFQKAIRAVRVVLESQAEEAPQVALGRWVVKVGLLPSEDKISKIKSGQIICQAGYSQKAVAPELGKGFFPLSPFHGSFPPLGPALIPSFISQYLPDRPLPFPNPA